MSKLTFYCCDHVEDLDPLTLETGKPYPCPQCGSHVYAKVNHLGMGFYTIDQLLPPSPVGMPYKVTYMENSTLDDRELHYPDYKGAIKKFQKLAYGGEEVSHVKLWKLTLDNDEIQHSKDAYKAIQGKNDNVVNIET